jgi:hypothetical protein
MLAIQTPEKYLRRVSTAINELFGSLLYAPGLLSFNLNTVYWRRPVVTQTANILSLMVKSVPGNGVVISGSCVYEYRSAFYRKQ